MQVKYYYLFLWIHIFHDNPRKIENTLGDNVHHNCDLGAMWTPWCVSSDNLVIYYSIWT